MFRIRIFFHHGMGCVFPVSAPIPGLGLNNHLKFGALETTQPVVSTTQPVVSTTQPVVSPLNPKLDNSPPLVRPNYIVYNTNYSIIQPLETHIRAKNLLSTTGKNTSPLVVQHTLRSNPNRQHIKDWDVCEYARKIYCEPNAGGKSINSEAFSVNVLNELYGITDILSEMEVEYIWYNYKKCDYICTIFGQRVGVSVTRAMGYPDPSHFTVEDADRLLTKKINGLLVAREGVLTKYDFDKCILHMWCESKGIADTISERHALLPDEVKDNILVVLTVTKPYSSPFIYYDEDADIVRERILSETESTEE